MCKKSSKAKKHPTESKCVTCDATVQEKQKSIVCDLCEKYTHLGCDSKIPIELYDSLNKYPDNPLIYLCKSCKPLVLPPGEKLDAISKKIEDACKSKIRSIRSEQDAPMDFLVTKSNNIEDSLQSLHKLVSELSLTKFSSSSQNLANAPSFSSVVSHTVPKPDLIPVRPLTNKSRPLCSSVQRSEFN